MRSYLQGAWDSKYCSYTIKQNEKPHFKTEVQDTEFD